MRQLAYLEALVPMALAPLCPALWQSEPFRSLFIFRGNSTSTCPFRCRFDIDCHYGMILRSASRPSAMIEIERFFLRIIPSHGYT